MFAGILMQLIEAHGVEAISMAFSKIFDMYKAGQPLTREEIEAILDEYPLKKLEYDDVPEDE